MVYALMPLVIWALLAWRDLAELAGFLLVLGLFVYLIAMYLDRLMDAS